ncbi:MAG TPA: agmatine deiminase family protein [Polyangiaceae bacterium]|nr:agmatine deiminase family protein [Polyangiaceae bacterium]
MTTPLEAGFRMPAEWAPHAATWVAWPSHDDLWREHIAGARAAFARLVAEIARGERVEVLVPDEARERLARAALAGERVRFHRVPFGDVWLRDTAPLFVVGQGGQVAAARFAFNGWGGKYVLEHDDAVAERVAALAGVRSFERPFVLEGGAVDVDGEGTVLTTRQCLLNRNRNGPVDEATAERALRDGLGADRVLWLDEGLRNDHTDGHVDTIARFVRPGVVVLMEPRSGDDPNRDTLRALIAQASRLSDARGRRLELALVPSPGLVPGHDGRPAPASYVNFYVANASVIVPTYGSPWDAEAVERIGALFAGRRVVGVDARAVLTGGGAFHCVTQQQPEALA